MPPFSWKKSDAHGAGRPPIQPWHKNPDGASFGWSQRSHSKRRFLLWRFLSGFVVLSLFIGGWMAVLALLVTRLVGGDGEITLLIWASGCGLSVLAPMLLALVIARAFHGIATPLTDVMAAADAVAEGDLSVRVPERGQREMARLARSFNRMTAELERSDQQRRNLTADVAHELRTPLHVIQGNLEGVLDGVYEPSPEHMEATLDETRRLARLVEDLRTLSLAEAGQLPLALEPTDLAELLADVDTSFRAQAEAAGIELVVETAANTPLIDADVGRLYQVLSNLMSNALRHTPSGGRVMLCAEPVDDGVQICVRDTGSGIAEADLPFVFDRFWRGDRARTHSAGGGSGLGLAIARQLVRTHGGTIHVESTVGVGTEFCLYLPVSVAAMNL